MKNKCVNMARQYHKSERLPLKLIYTLNTILIKIQVFSVSV